nr:unnamed protein product [Callosobruchus chinensis]
MYDHYFLTLRVL